MWQIADFVQGIIAVLSGAAVWLSYAQDPAHRRVSAWLGLSAQPFWLYSTAVAAQWGMFVLAVVYTAAFIKGLRRVSVK